MGVVCGFLGALFLFWSDFYLRLIIIIFIGLSIGLIFYRFWDNHQKSIVLPFEQEINFEGQVISHPDFLKSNARYLLSFQETKIQIVASRYPEYQYGDILKIKGDLKKANDYQFHQGILGVIYNPILVEKTGQKGNSLIKIVYQIRDRFEQSLNRSLSEPYSSFAAGLVLGSKRNIPDSLMSDFNRTGTTHIVAVSGYNVTIIVVYLGLLLGILSRKLKFWGSLVIILSFVVMTGASASVVRAGILAALVCWGQFEGRRINMTILLLLVAVCLLFFNPYALKFDISFQLSFLAFAGLIYLSGPLVNLKIIRWLPNFWQHILAETVAAQIMVLPILIYYFGRVSLISPLVNILILWLIPAAMFAVFAIGFGGLIFALLGQVVGYVGWILLKYIIVVVESFSRISWASFQIKTTSWWWMTIFYVLIGLWIYKTRNQNDDEKFKT